jgi:hypothetical protein
MARLSGIQKDLEIRSMMNLAQFQPNAAFKS